VTRLWSIATTSFIFVQNEIEDAIEFAKNEFKLSSRQHDGSTLRDQLNAVWKMTGNKPPELETQIELPELFHECWYWFLRLNSKRTSNGFGYNPLPYSEIHSFFELNNYNPQYWELLLIEKFDEVALEFYAKQQEQRQKKESKVKK